MKFLKGSLFMVLFMIRTIGAINFDFFSFHRASTKNETNETIPIEPTQMISIKPTQTISASIIITESRLAMLPTYLPEVNMFLAQFNRHEFENETEAVDASPEKTTEKIFSKPGLNGQEIDETKYFAKQTKLPAPVDSISLPRIPPPKVPNLPKRKTLQFTQVVLSQYTKYETVYPSCIKIENAESTCDGDLITIQPTHILPSDERTQIVDPINDAMFDEIDPPGSQRKRTFNKVDKVVMDRKSLEEKRNLSSSSAFLQPSELDFEFEEFDGTEIIPKVEVALNNEPKLEIITKYISTTVVRTVTNIRATATVIARNCIPNNNYNLKKCPMSEHEKIPTRKLTKPLQITYKQNAAEPETTKKQTTETYERKIVTIKPSTEQPPIQEPYKPYDIFHQLNQYLIMNAHRLIHKDSPGYEMVDLNFDSTVIESADPETLTGPQPQNYYKWR